MSIRTERLASEIRKDLGGILQKDFQPQGSFVSVTQVVVTDDLSIAKVYLSIFAPGRDIEPIFHHIDQSQQEIRHQLAGRIRHQVRRIPELLFYIDETPEKADRMEDLFRRVREADEKRSSSAQDSIESTDDGR